MKIGLSEKWHLLYYDFLQISRRKNVQIITCTYISYIHILAEFALNQVC